MLLLLATLMAAGPAAAGGGVLQAAEDLADHAAEDGEPGTVALAVVAPGAEGLREPLETAIAGALARRGQAVVPLRGAQLADPEGAARALEADSLLRIRASLTGATLALTAEIVPTRPNFFMQRAPAARAGGSRLLSVTAPADEATRALASASRTAARAVKALPLAELPERVLALAAGVTETSSIRLVAITPTGVALLDRSGVVLAFRPLPPAPAGRRVRDAAAVVALADFGVGRIAYAVAGRPEGEILSAAGDRLEHAGWIPSAPSGSPPVTAVPIAAGGAGTLFGAFVPGRGVLADVLSQSADLGARPTTPRELLGAAAAPQPGRVAYGVLGADYALRLLGPRLDRVLPDLAGIGAGFALADLDGDGEPELVASSAQPGPSDRARVIRLAPAATVFESQPVEGAFLAGAAADLTGDGLDDAVLAAAQPGGRTRLWLLTADARGGAP